MLVCDAIPCDSQPVRVCRIAGVVRDYCLWHRRLFQDVEAYGWDYATAVRRRRATPLPVVRGALQAGLQQPGPDFLHDALPAGDLAHAPAPS